MVFSEISLTKKNQDTFSNDLVWAIYQTDSSYQNETLLKSGSFSSLSGFLSGDKELVIKTDIPLKKGESQSFILRVGLLESGAIQNRDAGSDLSFKIQVDTYDRVETVSKQSVYHYKEGESPVITDEQKASVTKIILQNRITPIEGAEASLDFSPNQDGSCMVYLAENQDEAGTYTVYFQGNDEIWLEEGIRFFQGFIKLREIENIGVLNTSQVTSMWNMFAYCTSLTFLDVSSFMTTNVTNMNGMFSHCTALTNLDLSNFSTPEVTNMQTMFDSCWNLVSVNLSNFDMSKVQNTKWMFSACRNLKAINFGNFNYSSIVDSEAMFGGVNADIVITITNSDAISWLQDKLASGSVVVSA